jgi:hypothetical protein
MILYILGGLAVVSFLWRRYTIKRRVDTADKEVQAIVEIISLVTPMDIDDSSSGSDLDSLDGSESGTFAHYFKCEKVKQV